MSQNKEQASNVLCLDIKKLFYKKIDYLVHKKYKNSLTQSLV